MFLLSAENWRFLLGGAQVTLQVTFFAVVVGTVVGVLGGIISLTPSRVARWFTRVYVEVFRGVAALILLYWAYYSLPELFGLDVSQMEAAVLALGTNMGAYCTELARGAIQAVPRGQTEASIAVNLSAFQRMRHVILPQALISMLPPYGNLLIEVLKASALVSLIALEDIMRRAQILRNNRVDSTVDIFVATLLLYFAISGVITLLVRVAEHRFSRGMDIGRAAREVK